MKLLLGALFAFVIVHANTCPCDKWELKFHNTVKNEVVLDSSYYIIHTSKKKIFQNKQSYYERKLILLAKSQLFITLSKESDKKNISFILKGFVPYKYWERDNHMHLLSYISKKNISQKTKVLSDKRSTEQNVNNIETEVLNSNEIKDVINDELMDMTKDKNKTLSDYEKLHDFYKLKGDAQGGFETMNKIMEMKFKGNVK